MLERDVGGCLTSRLALRFRAWTAEVFVQGFGTPKVCEAVAVSFPYSMVLFHSHFTFWGALVLLSENNERLWVISCDRQRLTELSAFAFVPDFLQCVRESSIN